MLSGPGAPAENMAIDEALLEFSETIGAPVLRLYAWSSPAATFGFFQKFRDVEAMTALRPLIRRPTGGGLVPHDCDWTYSLVFPPAHEWHGLRATASYRRVHAWLQESFRAIGVGADLAQESQASASGQCFIGAEQFDVIAGGQKIAGAAQRRNRAGLLIQGSIQPPAHARREDWETALRAGRSWLPFVAPSGFAEHVRKLVAEKYSRRDYNERR